MFASYNHMVKSQNLWLGEMIQQQYTLDKYNGN